MSNAERDPHVLISSKIGSSNKMLRLPSHRARWGWIVMLGQAKLHHPPGRFDSIAQLKFLAGEFRDCVTSWVTEGLLHAAPAMCPRCISEFGPMGEDEGQTPPEAFVVHDWRRHQERSRTTIWREENAIPSGHVNKASGNDGETVGETTGKQLPPRARVSAAVAVPVKETTEGVQGEPDPWEAFRARTGSIPGPKLGKWLNDLSAKHGDTAVSAAISAEPLAGRIPPDYLRAIEEGLALEARRAERAELADELARNAAKRRPLTVARPPEDISDEEAAALARAYRGGAA